MEINIVDNTAHLIKSAMVNIQVMSAKNLELLEKKLQDAKIEASAKDEELCATIYQSFKILTVQAKIDLHK